jgi:hypothetical protein
MCLCFWLVFYVCLCFWLVFLMFLIWVFTEHLQWMWSGLHSANRPFNSKDWGDMFLQNIVWLSTDYIVVMTQKTVLLKVTLVSLNNDFPMLIYPIHRILYVAVVNQAEMWSLSSYCRYARNICYVLLYDSFMWMEYVIESEGHSFPLCSSTP